MNDYKIVIDAGHGGEDPGALGNGITEKDMTLAISEYMYDRFRELGIPVKLTRNSDETVNPTDRVNRILDAFGNDDDVIVISNHINAGGGASFYVIKLWQWCITWISFLFYWKICCKLLIFY